MAKTKKAKGAKRIPKKYLVPLLLLFAVIIIGVCITYAWFLNIINVDGMDIRTGNFKYEFTGFYKNEVGELSEDFSLSTDDPNSEAIQKESLTATTQASTLISPTVNGTGEIYYVVKKLPESVDLDISINFIAAVQDIEEIGGFWYKIDTVKGSSGENAETIVNAARSAMEAANTTDDERVMYNIENDVRKETLASSENYWCFRLTYGLKDNAVSPAYTGKSLSIYPVLYVAQVGGLPEDIDNKEPIKVRSAGELDRALSVYTVGQEIQILNDITYEGDLIFNRPVTLKPWGAKLTVKGDVRFTYAGGGQFYINTAQNGFLEVLHVDGTVSGGNIYIETPNAGTSFIGKNDKDITVDGDVMAEASYNTGLFISKSQIVDRSGNNLKAIYLRGRTFLDVDFQTEVGEIGVYDAPLHSVKIVNNGTVNTIRLTSMARTDDPPSNIYIENRSVIKEPIYLPSWAFPYKEGGNTRVIVHQSASGTTTISPSSQSDFEDEDIERMEQELLVEMAENNSNHITVHYMNGIDGESKTLRQIIHEYQTREDDKKIPESSMITYMKIICYGEVVLTSDDYAFIRGSMISLETLDLSRAVSSSYKTPDNAFNGELKKLETVYMSENDTEWGKYIFKNTNVIDVKIPLLTVSMNADTFAKSDTETVKYIHIQQATTHIDNLPAQSYLFVPDEATVAEYITSTRKKVYVEATRFTSEYGDFFLRMLGGTCVFVTYAGDADDWYKAFKSVETVTLDNAPDGSARSYLRIDMSSVKVSLGEQIISSIDGYAFYDRFRLLYAKDINEKYYIDFGSTVTSIGDNAFTNCDMIVGAEGSAVSYLGERAFNNCSKLVKLVFPSLTSMTVKESHSVYNCASLQWVETGVLNKTENNSQAKAFIDKAAALKLHIVHSTGEEFPEAINTPKFIETAPTQNVYALVPQNVYSAYTGVGRYRVLNVNDCDVSFYPVIPSENIYDMPKFAVSTDATGNQTLLVCISDKLEAADVFTDYPNGVSTIGENAFRYVTVYSDTPTSILRFPDCVTSVEAYAFAASDDQTASSKSSNTKVYHTLDLNNVTSVKHYVFARNTMIEVSGPAVESIGAYSFAYTNMYQLDLPALRYGYAKPQGTDYPAYFRGCKNLRYANLGPCDNLGSVDTWAFWQCTKLSIVTIDGENRAGDAKAIKELGWYGDTAKFIVIVSGGQSVINEAGNKNYEILVDSLSDLLYVDFTTNDISESGLTGTISTPSIIFERNGNGTYSYRKCNLASISGEYTVPSTIHTTGDTIEFLGETVNVYALDTGDVSTQVGYINSIAGGAYSEVSFAGCKKLTMSPFITTIGASVFAGCAAEEVDLVNVEVVGVSAFSGAKLKKLTADHVKIISEESFYNCVNLTEVEFPALELANGTSNGPFAGSGLKKITLGPNTRHLGTYMFYNCRSLHTIVIQSPVAPVAIDPFYLQGGQVNPNNITMVVREQAGFLKDGATNWHGVPAVNFEYYDNSTEIDKILYYWNIVAGTNEAKITGAQVKDGWQDTGNGVLTIPSVLNIPSSELASVLENALTAMSELLGENITVNLDGYRAVLGAATDDDLVSAFLADAKGDWVSLKQYLLTTLTENGALSEADANAKIAEVMANESLMAKLDNAKTTALSVGEYKVIYVNGEALRIIGDSFKYKELQLPYALRTLDFGYDSLPTTLERFSITPSPDGELAHFKVDSRGALYNWDRTILLLYPNGNAEVSYTVPVSVTIISANAFRNAILLNSVVIEGSVTISNNAFDGCSYLSTITFKSETPSLFLGNDILNGCINLQQIVVPQGAKDAYAAKVIYDRNIIETYLCEQTE